MSILFMDGFDKLGSIGGGNGNIVELAAMLAWSGWSGASNVSPRIVTRLSSTGYALSINPGSSPFRKSLSASYSRLIGGFRFTFDMASLVQLQITDGVSVQCTIVFEADGSLSLRTGTYPGTLIARTQPIITANAVYHLEWDITVGPSGAYNLYLDTRSVLNGTGNTRTTANSSTNGIQFLYFSTSVPTIVLDDFYLLNTSGTTNNVPLLTAPRIETSFPTGDVVKQFGFGAAVLGETRPKYLGAVTFSANNINLLPIRPRINCTLNSISLTPIITAAGVNFRGVLYADNAGVASTLLSSGTTVVGMTTGVPLVLPLVTPQALTANTTYWLGCMNSTAISAGFYQIDTTTNYYFAIATFTSGAPATAPALNAGVGTPIWGNLADPGVNWYLVMQQLPPLGLTSYVASSTNGAEDLYSFPALTGAPVSVYGVGVNVLCNSSDGGARTVAARMRSGATTVSGPAQSPSTGNNQVPGIWETDPNTGAAWTVAGVNAAASGVRIES